MATWHGDLDIKVAELNAQHERLISLFYDLQEAIIGNKANEKIEAILMELEAYTKDHFLTEEKYFKTFNYPETDHHVKEHKKFSKTIIELKNNVRSNELKTSLILIKYLQRWINNHILTEDKKYSAHFNLHGLR